MSAAQNDWSYWLTRNGRTPALWLTQLLVELKPVMLGSCSVGERELVAQDLLSNPRYGYVDADRKLGDDNLQIWEDAEHTALSQQSADGLQNPRPSQALPLLVRELAQSIKLGGFDPVGPRSDEDPIRTGLQARLTKHACDVYQWECEQNVAQRRDWVPRVEYKTIDESQWAEADGVGLPLFFVITDAAGNSEGVNGRLRLWLWPCQGARLAWLPTIPQRVQPLARSWDRGLDQALTWIRQQMQVQGGDWQNHALVWDVYTPDHGHCVLSGASASAAFALAGLWLVRRWAPEQWKAQLISMAQKDWLQTHITAVICPGNLSGNGQQDLMPVEGVLQKSFASWVLKQGNRNGNVPLHVASGQIVEAAALGQPEPEIHSHVSAFALMHRLARQALNLSEKQTALHASLDKYLLSFAPTKEDADPDAPWHLPNHNPPQIKHKDAAAEEHWQQVVEALAFDASPPEHLVPFALTRWAKRASEMHDGGQVHRLFVNLHVSEQHRPQKRGQVTRTAAAGGMQPEYDSLAQLLAAYEDRESPAQQVQALQIVGAPGSGKTWLLARFEQACMERLLWQHDRQASQPQAIDVAQIEADPYPYFSVPLYVPLSTLPMECQTAKDILDWFRGQVLGSTNPPNSRLRNRLLQPNSERNIHLRVILDGLNELKVALDQTRQARAKQVVRAIWQGLKPGLPMLLGTRTHHEFALDDNSDAASPFQVAVANLLPWRLNQIKSYLGQRWAHHTELLERTDSIVAKLERDDQQRLREVLSLPLYLRIQCELMEAGATELLDSQARLLAALLWHKLRQELVAKSDLVSSDEALLVFPRKKQIRKEIFKLAREIWVTHQQVPRALGKVVEWINAADPKSTMLQPGVDLKLLVEPLSSGNLLDILDTKAVRSACQERSSATIEGHGAYNNDAYKKKYDPDYYVRRRNIEWRIGRMLLRQRLPVLFLKAGSGQGKTCFVRNLYDRLDKSKHSIPMLVRGLSGVDQQVSIRKIMGEVAENAVGRRDLQGRAPIDLLDQALALAGVNLVVILDGVNEASGDTSAVFGDAMDFLEGRIEAGRNLGFFTSFRLIVTSRPGAFTGWYRRKFKATELLDKIRRVGAGNAMTAAEPLLEFNNLSDEELDEGLRRAGLSTIDPHMRKLLADPLLLGFYRELSAASDTSGPDRPATPLALINQYWENQLKQIEKLASSENATRGSDDYLAAIKVFCQSLLASRNSLVIVNWSETFQQIPVREVLLFEQESPPDKGLTPLLFRYDRLAQLLVARFAILETASGSQRSVDEISDLMVRVTLATMREATFTERDVIRGSLIDALSWRLGSETLLSPSSTFDLALSLLNRAHPALAGVDQNIVDSCMLALSEIVHDFFIHSGRWHGPRLVGSISAWFARNRRDESSVAARVLRRVVFNLLRGDNLGESVAPSVFQGTQQARLDESRQKMHELGAIALMTETSGDPAVLLHALHSEGKVGDSLGILKEAVEQMTKFKLTLWTPRGLLAMKHVGLALLLIAPEAIKDKRFLTCVGVVFKKLPASLIATTASLLTDMALNDNAMPFRRDELLRMKSADGQFLTVVKLLSDDGWSDASMADFASVAGVRQLSGVVRNGITTQLLSNALSCRILLANELARSQLIAELKQTVDDMCKIVQTLGSAVEADTACELGSSAYLLSLVCYHLVVFDTPKSLESEGRPCLPRESAEKVFECMYRLADEVLLQPPFLGRFRFRPNSVIRENSNIVGTLGRAALEMGKTERFQRLVSSKAQSFAVGSTGRFLTVEQHHWLLREAAPLEEPNKTLVQVDFADFLLDSLATLGTLSQKPEFALTCIYDTACVLGAPAFAEAEPAKESDFGLISMANTMKALLQVRAVHPFAVEQYIMDHQNKRSAAPVLRHLRVVPVKVSRHLSWTFEHCIERVIADYPDAVRIVRDDTLDNLHPHGLRVVAARSIYRLTQWVNGNDSAHGKGPQVLSPRQRALAQFAGFLGGVGGPIGVAIKWVRHLRQQALAQFAKFHGGVVGGPIGVAIKRVRRKF